MYIENIRIKNFRTIGNKGISLDCNKGMNLLIGENNSGKSSIIDALRLVLATRDFKRDIYINPNDFHIDRFGHQSEVINIDIKFGNLSLSQSVAFFMLTNGINLDKAELHVEYSTYFDKQGIKRVREDIKGGPVLNIIPRETFDNINISYLAALRDANLDLKPSRYSKLARLLYSFTDTEDKRDNILDVFAKANKNIQRDASIVEIENLINRNLQNIEREELKDSVQVSLVDPSIESIASTLMVNYTAKQHITLSQKEWYELLEELHFNVDIVNQETFVHFSDNFKTLDIEVWKIKNNQVYKDLYIKLVGASQIENFNIKQNGLGYNNILHMATSLSDLQGCPDDDIFSILLVEEPEAHLHPQLLDLLFSFFCGPNKNSEIQIFITSHSPTLVSKAKLDNIHVISTDIFNNNHIVSLKKTSLTDKDKNDLKRYLDVTKSQLFFAKKIMFVEGISEAILIQEFARFLNKPLDKYSIEIVNINGVAFEPFSKLFITEGPYDFFNIPCVIITDDDRCTNNKSPETFINSDERKNENVNFELILEKIDKGEISERVNKLENLCNKTNIHLELATKTLEFVLAKTDENYKIMLKLLNEFHPKICLNIINIFSQEKIESSNKTLFIDKMDLKGNQINEIAVCIWIALQDIKGEFAQRLAAELSGIRINKKSEVKFTVPKYILDAIDYLTQ